MPKRLHPKRYAVRARRRKRSGLRDSAERVHRMDDDRELRRSRHVYGHGKRFGVRMRALDLQLSRDSVPRQPNARHLHGRRPRLPVRRVLVHLYGWPIVLGVRAGRDMLRDLRE